MSTAKELGERIKDAGLNMDLDGGAAFEALVDELVSLAPAEQAAGAPVAWWDPSDENVPFIPNAFKQANPRAFQRYAVPLATSPQPPATHPGWPCEIESADFEAHTITVRMMTNNYRVAAGRHILIPAGIPKESEHG